MIIIKTTIGSSISMKLAYQTQTEQYNDQSRLTCFEHSFVVNKIHTSIEDSAIKIRFESVMWHASIIHVE